MLFHPRIAVLEILEPLHPVAFSFLCKLVALDGGVVVELMQNLEIAVVVMLCGSEFGKR